MTIGQYYVNQAVTRGIPRDKVQPGSVTFIQRFGSALNLSARAPATRPSGALWGLFGAAQQPARGHHPHAAPARGGGRGDGHGVAALELGTTAPARLCTCHGALPVLSAGIAADHCRHHAGRGDPDDPPASEARSRPPPDGSGASPPGSLCVVLRLRGPAPSPAAVVWSCACDSPSAAGEAWLSCVLPTPPAHPAAARMPYPLSWKRAARPHACAPVSRCTTVPSRSPPQRLQRCKSFAAALIASSTALIAFDSAPRQQSPPSSPSRPARVAPAAPAARHLTPARRASRRRPAACADCARLARLGEPPVAPADVLA
jgi:hypothetical protein